MPDFNFDAPKDMKNLFADTAKAAEKFKETSEKAGVTPKFDFSNVKLNGFNDKFVDSLEFNDSFYDITLIDEPDIPLKVPVTDEPINPPSPNEPEQVDLSDLFGQLKSMMNHIRSNYNTIVNTIVSAATGNAAANGTGNTAEPDETEQAESTFTNAQLQGRSRLAQKYVADTLADIKSELLAQGYNAAKLDTAVAFLTELYGYRISNAIYEGNGLTIKKNDMKNYILNYFRTDWYSQGNDDVHDLQVLNTWKKGRTRSQESEKNSLSDAKSLAKTWVVIALLSQLKLQLKNLGLDADKVDSAYTQLVNDYTSFIDGAREGSSHYISGLSINYSNKKYTVTYNESDIADRFKELYMTHTTSSSNNNSPRRSRGGSGTGSGTRTGNSTGRTRTGSSTGRSGSSPTRTRSSASGSDNAPTRSSSSRNSSSVDRNEDVPTNIRPRTNNDADDTNSADTNLTDLVKEDIKFKNDSLTESKQNFEEFI